MQNLKKENSASSQSTLQTLAELMHCLMYQHTGFPELYEPILDCLQVICDRNQRLRSESKLFEVLPVFILIKLGYLSVVQRAVKMTTTVLYIFRKLDDD